MLFGAEDLDQKLNERKEKIEPMVEEIPVQDFFSLNYDKLIDPIVSKLEVKPIKLHEEQVSDPQETQVEVQPRPANRHRSSVPGHKVEVSIPFEGDKWIFCFRTNPSLIANFPNADVKDDSLNFIVSQPDDVNPESFKDEVNEQVKLIREHAMYANDQICLYNKNLPNLVQNAVESRRLILKQQQERQVAIKKILDES